MKKFIFVLILAVASFWSKPVKAQSTYQAQRDSIQALFTYVLIELDSVMGKNIELTKQLSKQSSEMAKLKMEVENLLKKKSETASEIAKTKKLLSDQTALIEKLEAEIKRLSQPKKTQ